MKKQLGITAMVLMVASSVVGAEASLTVDVASAYVYRGLTLNDGAVVQPGLELVVPGGLTVGAWANLDVEDYGGILAKGEFSEVDLSLSYALPVELLDVLIGYTELLYPMGGVPADREMTAALGGSAGPVDLGAGLYYGVGGGIRNDLYLELSVGSAIDVGVTEINLMAVLGYLHPDEGESGFSHYELTAGLTYGRIGASVTYIGQIDDKVLPDVKDGGGYDVKVVGMLSAALRF